MRTRSTALLLGGLAAGLVAACGGGGGGDGDGGSSGTEAGVLVMTGTASLEWEPETASVPAGEVEIELRNNSSVQHNLYLVGADGTEHPKSLQSNGMNDNPRGSFRLQPGSYTIICKVPGHDAMKAALTVS